MFLAVISYSWPKNNQLFLAEYIDLTQIKPTLETVLTTWTEWSSCSPYCQQSRHRVCSGGFQCFDDDGDSTTLCTGNGWTIGISYDSKPFCQPLISESTTQKSGNTCEAQHKSCDYGAKCFDALRNNRLVSSSNLEYCEKTSSRLLQSNYS